MLLTITTTHTPATDLGYLLHKHPARVQTFSLAFGQAHVFYPEASEDRCACALLLDIDPVGLVRDRRGPSGAGRSLEQYVNDRPYVASSFLSVAIGQVFRSAMAGNAREKADLVDQPLPLTATLAVVPCRGGEALLRRLFEPLGYTVTAQPHPLDETFPSWGQSRYFTVTLEGNLRLRDVLTHLYVLIPVLDDDKHYWVGDDEVEKLLRRGEGWLAAHPERDLIATRYLRHERRLTREALDRLIADEGPDPDEQAETKANEEGRLEARVGLHDQRLGAVVAALKERGAHRVLDLGCGEGRLLQRLLDDPSFTEIVGLDVAHRALEIARRRLRYDRLPPARQARLTLLHGSLVYRDERLAGYDAAALVEVIEHLDAARLLACERMLFEHARPATVILTTPNIEYNVRFETLPAGRLRHRDHRFEWTRAEFRAWAVRVAAAHGYEARFLPVGPEDPVTGPPTQMGVFDRREEGAAAPAASPPP
jgi:3' terminal RNA ribose 2'-O-methyltransferase Hen1